MAKSVSNDQEEVYVGDAPSLLSSAVKDLVHWLQHDILPFENVKPKDREELYDFIVNEFHRSAHPANRGKTPAQLMTGKDHPHWLELLGFEKFKRAA